MIPFRTFISILVFTVAMTCAAAPLGAPLISNFSAQITIVSNNVANGTLPTACLAHPSLAGTITSIRQSQPAYQHDESAGQKSRGPGQMPHPYR
jgi:hypothetical protein